MRSRLMGIVAEVGNRRVYFAPTPEAEAATELAVPRWRPEAPTRGTWASNAQGRRYGFKTFGDYFTNRQLCALTTFSDLISEVRQKARNDGIANGMPDDGLPLNDGGVLATAYADAVAVYLSFALSKIANIGSSIASWMSDRGAFRETFARQGIAMAWDFVEANPFSDSGGSFSTALDKCAMVIGALPATGTGHAFQANAATQTLGLSKIISTDPPYYDNVGYADLADFFYVWLRRSLRDIFPDVFASLASPKSEELVACSYRHGSKNKAETFFMAGMSEAMHQLAQQAHPAFPTTIYYAFKQSETKEGGTSSSGWETFLEAVLKAGFALSGTWPMRTEGAGRIVAQEANSLASSIVLVCRKRSLDAPTVSRREFIRELNGLLPEALDEMTKGAGGEHSPVAPVDLSQSIIGPGMAVFSKYAAVLEADGSPMSVRTALQLINRFLAEDDFDAESQFCLHWFEQYKWADGPFGVADTLSRGKGTNVDRMKEAGVLQSGGGKVKLLKWADYPTDWDPRTDNRTPVWEALHQLIRALKQGGETASGALLAALGGKAEAVRQLAYRLYTLCERLGQAEDARAYNELITSWSGIEAAANSAAPQPDPQGLLFES
jgi:putative DNA methylase